jgi:hypothetical protein
VIDLRSAHPRFADGFIEAAVGDLWEPWMRQADRVLEDEMLLNIVYEALLRRAIQKAEHAGVWECLPSL